MSLIPICWRKKLTSTFNVPFNVYLNLSLFAELYPLIDDLKNILRIFLVFEIDVIERYFSHVVC